MSSHFALYGSRDPSPAAVQEGVGRALGVRFEAHESSYWGEYYASGPPGGELFEVRPNRDAEGELAEPEFPDYPTLVYLNGTPRPEVATRALREVESLVKLREEWLDD